MASFKIHNDQENKVNEIQKLRKELGNQLQPQKRAVLGVLNKNLNHAQTETSKGGKQDVANNENVKIKKKVPLQSQKCVIEDRNPIKVQEKEIAVPQELPVPIKSRQELPDTITALPRAPLQDLHLADVLHITDDSPMVLDKSDISTPLKSKSRSSVDLIRMSEYSSDIYCYLRNIELKNRPKSCYMKKQPDISYSMRSILVDWLVEVTEEYKLQAETLHLAVSYIDRFLSYMSVVRAKLQLVGTAAMFIASKYEEIYPPDVGEFVYITDDTYNKKQVLRMEHLIVKVLSFDLSGPTSLSFITLYNTMYEMPETVLFLAMFLSELSLLEGDPFMQYLPSVLAAASLALARHTLELEVWPIELEKLAGYNLSQLKLCIKDLEKTFSESSSHPQQGIREKYKAIRFNSVSLLTPRSPSLFSCN